MEKAKSKKIAQFLRPVLLVLFFVTLFGFSLFKTSAAEAASMYFVPNSGTRNLGDSFSVSVYLSSADQAANAVSGALSFPADKMTVTSFSKSGSIISLWTQEPTFSNGNGTARFEGIVLNPGYKGSGAKILTLNFKVRATGSATINFTSGSILANDGLGTNIMSGLGNAKFAFNAPTPKTKPLLATTPVPTPATPGAPQITSPSHPDLSGWYADRNPIFNWVIPADTTGVSFSIDQNGNSDPGQSTKGIFSFYTAKNIGDGSWYFHLRLSNKAGWGSISHYRFQIDSQPPQPFSINALDGLESESPTPRFSFFATDTLSGIDYYKIKVNNGDYVTASPAQVASGPLSTTPQMPGKSTIIVIAVDKAGNASTETLEFTVVGLMPPEFTEYSSSIESGQPLVAGGKTYPNSDVTVLVTSDISPRIEQIVRSDAGGQFVFVSPQKLKDGLYQLSALVSDARGAQSEYSRPITVAVEPPPFIRIGTLALNFLAILVPLVGLLILLVLLVVWLYRKYHSFRSKIKKEATEAETVLHQSFMLLRENLKKYITSLESVQQARHLTMEEEAMMIQLKNDLTIVENMVVKGIKAIEEEVK